MSFNLKIKRLIKKINIELIKINHEHKFVNKKGELKYLFIPKKNSNFLLVVFSAFPNINRPASYNYVDTFKNVNCNRLYILDDYGPDIRGGSYYLGKNKDFFIKDMVTELIEEKSKELNIPNKNIITTGTSKGGFASLYFAFKNSYGHTISGAPQILLGDYLKNHVPCFEYIAGSFNDENIHFLNNQLLNMVKKNKGIPSVYLHVGKGEHHYPDHILPFCEFLDNQNIKYELDLGNYNSHGEVGNYYPKFALKCLDEIINQR